MEDEKELNSVDETLAMGKETVEKIIKYLQGKGMPIDIGLLSKQVDENGDLACPLGTIDFQTDSGIMRLQLLMSDESDFGLNLRWAPAGNTDIDVFFGLEDELFEGFLRRRKAKITGPTVIVRSAIKKDFERILEQGIAYLDLFFLYRKKINQLDELMLHVTMHDKLTDGRNRKLQFALKEDGSCDLMPGVTENVMQNALNKIDAVIDYEQALSSQYVVINQDGSVANFVANLIKKPIGKA